MGMRTMNKLEIIKHLEGLADGSIEPADDRFGLCHEMSNWLPFRSDEWVSKMAVGWDKFTGIIDYPVPHPSMTPERAYQSDIELWTGQYGDNRRELCAFVAKRMREELE